MRRSLLTAAAVAPLALAFGGPALAQVTISGAQTTPINTSTANNGAPSDVTITGTASGTPVAVTLDSNNNLTNSGTISTSNVDNSTGVLILGGHTGSFTNSGSITINETYTPTDQNGDGVVDGDYAQGSGRYGLRLIGPGTFTNNGSVQINSVSTPTALNLTLGSSITVQGNGSYGVSLEAPIAGDVLVGNLVSVTGGNVSWTNPEGINGTWTAAPTGSNGQSIAFSESGGVVSSSAGGGKVQITGAITATGGAAVGADFSGDIAGSLSVYSAITSTGYRQTVRSTDPSVNSLLTTPSLMDLLQSGSALSIRASVGGGVFLGAPPATTVSTDTTTDADHDGIVDSVETASTITTYGEAPALLVGGTGGKNITLGYFSSPSSANPVPINEYGLIIEGSVSGNGVFDTYSGAGIQIGSPDGTGTVTIDGGVRIVGSVTSQGYENTSTAIHYLKGVTAPTLQVEGSVTANGTTSQTNTPAVAVLLDPGAHVTTLNNEGAITAAMTGDYSSAKAVVDQSGSIRFVTNTNTISATIAPTNLGDTTHGQTVALDLSANTLGVTLTQSAYVQPPNTVAPTTVPTPTITGDVYLGSGVNTVSLETGSILGALSFGGGGTFDITGGATYRGALTSNGPMTINVTSGTLEDDGTGAIKANSLTVGSGSQLIVSVDPVNNKATDFTVTGAATISSGAQLGLHVLSLPTQPAVYTVLTSPQLTSAVTNADLTGQTPYLFNASFQASPSTGLVQVSLSRRTAQQAGLDRADGEALDAVYNNLPADPGIERAFLSQTTQAGLVTTLNQMLPDYAGGVFRSLSWAAEQQGVATAEPPLGQDQAGPTRAWTQEIVLHEQKNEDQAAGYTILGFGLIGGVESVSPKGSALGVKWGFTTADIHDPSLPSENLEGVSEVNVGAYWRGDFNGLRADAQIGTGYVWIYNHREFLYTDSQGVVHANGKGRWDGFTLSGRFGLSYVAQFGPYFLEPSVHADYFRMHETGYTETGGDPGFDLSVDPRNGEALSVTSEVTAGATYGEGFRWRPQITVGYRSVLSGSAGVTTAQYAGGAPFALTPESIREGALIGRIGVRIYSDYLDLLLDGGGEFYKDYTDLDVHLTARTLF